MDEITTEPAVTIPKPVKPKPKAKRKKAAKPRRVVTAASPAKEPKDDLAGITARSCPRACTSERCIISTVNICKHPRSTSDSGCGPVTLRNRERALKYLKHQEIDRA